MKIIGTAVLLLSATSITGCASTYGNLVSGSKLGANEYQPAVLVNDGMDNQYGRVLSVCRTVATNKQITSAEEAQLATITGVSSAALDGAGMGVQMAGMLKMAGIGSSLGKDMMYGVGAGLLTSLGTAFSSGVQHNAESTKDVLLRCLKAADPQQRVYKVLG